MDVFFFEHHIEPANKKERRVAKMLQVEQLNLQFHFIKLKERPFPFPLALQDPNAEAFTDGYMRSRGAQYRRAVDWWHGSLSLKHFKTPSL